MIVVEFQKCLNYDLNLRNMTNFFFMEIFFIDIAAGILWTLCRIILQEETR